MANNIDNINDTESSQTNTGSTVVAHGVGGAGAGVAQGAGITDGVIGSGQLEVVDLTLPTAESGIADSNKWQKTSDWLEITAGKSGVLTSGSAIINCTAKTTHSGNSPRIGKLNISYWGTDVTNKKTTAVNVTQSALDAYSATDFWICIPKNNSTTLYNQYEFKSGSSISIDSSINHVKLLIRTNLNADKIKAALTNGIIVDGKVFTKPDAGFTADFYNYDISKCMFDLGLGPGDIGDATTDYYIKIDKFTKNAYIHLGIKLNVSGTTSIEEIGAITVNENWGDNRIKRSISIKIIKEPDKLNVTAGSNIPADQTDVTNIELSGTPGTNYDSELS